MKIIAFNPPSSNTQLNKIKTTATIIKIAEKLNISTDYLLALACKISTENKEKLLKEILEKNNLI